MTLRTTSTSPQLLEGYTLTGRHGIWSSYESFVHIVDSMINQHAKWLEATVRHIPWRKPISALNLVLSSHVWRQDHNGFSHQDPGFVDIMLNKSFNNDHITNIYFPADANLLLAVGEKCYTSTNCINAIFAGKQPAPTWVTLDEAREELAAGAKEWKWASNAEAGEEDIVLASCGDVPTQELLAALDMLGKLGIKARFVNVVDLLKIQNASENNEALSDEEFTKLFSADKPVLFAFHAYAGSVRRLIWDRPNHDNFNVHGYEEQGSTTTPYDMLRLNNMDRWALAADALRMIDAQKWADQIDEWEKFRTEAFEFAVEKGYDHPAFTDWSWPDASDADQAISATQATAGDNEYHAAAASAARRNRASCERRACYVRAASAARASCANVPSARYPLRVGTGFSCAKALLADGVSRQAGGARGVRSMRPGMRPTRA